LKVPPDQLAGMLGFSSLTIRNDAAAFSDTTLA